MNRRGSQFAESTDITLCTPQHIALNRNRVHKTNVISDGIRNNP